MERFRYPQKKNIFIFLLIVSLFLFGGTLSAQQLDEKSEKQLKIFQLSNFLGEEDSFNQPNAYLNNAQAYLENEHLGLAIGELEKIPYNHLYIPLYLRSQLLKAQCYEKIQRWESAIGIYQDLLNKVPIVEDYTIYLLAKVYKNINDINSAREAYLKIISDFPQSGLAPLVHYQLALLYKENGQWEQFWSECHLAVETSPEGKFKGKVLTEMSDISWEQGEYLTSLIYLKEVIENRYEREKITILENLLINRFQVGSQITGIDIPADVALFCAEILFNYRRYKIAETIYEEIIDKYADQIDLEQVYYQKVRAIYYQGEYERAIESCLYILANFKQEDIMIRTLYLYAGALLATGNRSSATEKYLQITESFPEHYFAQLSYLRLSEIEFLQNRDEEGINFLRQLITKYPSSFPTQEAAWKVARYYTNKGLIDESLSYYQFIYEHFPLSNQADDALYWMGKLLYPRERERGIQCLERLLVQFPDSYFAFRVPQEVRDEVREYYVSLSDIIAQSKEVSYQQFKKNYFPQSKIAQLSAYRAEILIFLKLYPESILEISSALKQEPDNVYLKFLLTQAHAEAGEYYLSISYAQSLLNYFLSNKGKNFPFFIWEYTFPVYYYDLVKRIALSYHLDPFLIWSIIREESHFNPYAESRAGARGLMQIIFSTGEWIAQKLNYQEFEDDLLFEPELNINLGCWYVGYLQERFNENYFFIISGYNAGPGITDRWLATINRSDIDSFVENIPYAETREHIKKVIRSYLIYQMIYKK